MSLRSIALPIVALCFAAAADAQPSARSPVATAAPSKSESGDAGFRDTSAYPFPALVRTVHDMQNVAQAMQLRNYCADERLSLDFVKAQLDAFSRITQRQENCRTLLDY